MKAAAEERRADALRREINASGIPKPYRDIDVLRAMPVAGEAAQLRQSGLAIAQGVAPRPGLLITGRAGSGKTVAAMLAGLEYLQAHVRKDRGAIPQLIFITVPEMLMRIRSTFGSYSESEEALIERYGRCEYLILDDLGTETASEFSVSRLWLIINMRYQYRKPTIITSNFPPSRLAQHLAPKDEIATAERIVDRLVEMCVWFDLQGPSFRTKDSPFLWSHADADERPARKVAL